MQRRLTDLIATIGLPVLLGQFLFDWISNGLLSAASHLPFRAVILFAILLGWAGFREHRERKKQTFR